MAKEETTQKGECYPPEKWHGKKWHRRGGGTMGWIYFLGIVGTAVHYVQQVSGFWPIVLAILKAIVWPAFLLYKVFSLLGM